MSIPERSAVCFNCGAKGEGRMTGKCYDISGNEIGIYYQRCAICKKVYTVIRYPADDKIRLDVYEM